MTKIALLFLICISANIVFAQKNDTLLDNRLKNIEDFIKNQDKIFHFGMSLGTRYAVPPSKFLTVGTIEPSANTLQLDKTDRLSLVLSSSLTIYPYPECGFGFTANINIGEFAENQLYTIFNKQIDGGVGIAYSFGNNRNMALAVTYERTSFRRLRDYVQEKKGQQLLENNVPITSLDIKDDRYYIDSGVNAVSIKYIYHFN